MLESFDLLDNMTAPLRSIEDALGGVTTRLVGAEREVNRASTAFGAVGKSTEHLAGSAQKFGHTERQLAGDTGRLGESMHGLGGETAAGALEFGMFLEIGRKVVDFLGEMVMKALEVGKAFAETAMQAGEFYARTKFALDFKLGKTGAAEALKDIENLATRAGVKIEEVGPAYQKLLMSGFNKQNAGDIFAASLDVRAGAGGDQGASDAFMETINRINASPDAKIDPRELRALSMRSGIDDKSIFAELGKMKHVDTSSKAGLAQIKDLAQNGGFNKEQLITAVMKATEKKMGGAGKGFGNVAIAFKNEDIESQMNSLHDNATKLFGGIDTKPIAEAVGKIAALLDPQTESGKKIKAIFDGISKAVGDFLGKLTSGPELGKTFDSLVDGITFAWNAIKAFGSGFMDAIGPALKSLKPLFDNLFGSTKGGATSFDGLVTAGKAAAEVFAFIAGQVLIFLEIVQATWTEVKIFGAVMGAVFSAIGGLVSGAWGAVTGALSGAGTWLVDTGKSIVDGLWGGISGAWDSLVAKVKGLAGDLVHGVRGALQMNSPSKVFMNIGGGVAEGFGMGVEDGQPPRFDHLIPKPDKISKLLAMPAINAPSLAAGMPDAPMAIPSPRVDAGAIGGTTNNSAKHVTVGDIHVTVGGAAQGPAAAAQAHDIANTVRAEILRVLESNAREQ